MFLTVFFRAGVALSWFPLPWLLNAYVCQEEMMLQLEFRTSANDRIGLYCVILLRLLHYFKRAENLESDPITLGPRQLCTNIMAESGIC